MASDVTPRRGAYRAEFRKIQASYAKFARRRRGRAGARTRAGVGASPAHGIARQIAWLSDALCRDVENQLGSGSAGVAADLSAAISKLARDGELATAIRELGAILDLYETVVRTS